MSRPQYKKEAFDKLSEWYYSYDPEAVCYIQRYDEDDEYVGELDGDFCEGCAERKAKELDDECHGKYIHRVCTESSPENCYFSYCQECGCLLNAALYSTDLAEDDIDELVEDLRKIKAFDELKGELSWKIWQFFYDEQKFKKWFPKQMNYLSRRIIILYKKYDGEEND